MNDVSKDDPISVSGWLIRLCQWGWRGRKYLVGTLFLSGIPNLLWAFPLVDPSTLHNLFWVWMLAHWYIFLSIFLGLLVLTVFCGLVARLNAPLSRRQLEIHYLKQVIFETERTTLSGIPEGLISRSVRLADIFIPLEFYPEHSKKAELPPDERELARYRLMLQSDTLSPDLQRFVYRAGTNSQSEGDRITIPDLWERLSIENAIVILGFPGIGKSTLMERLTLHMAYRSLHRPDPEMPEPERLLPVLLPILLRLGKFASALAEESDLSISMYLEHELKKQSQEGIPAFVQQALTKGRCLVLFDGLDEVSKPEVRHRVQDAIKEFVKNNYYAVNAPVDRHNRFI